MSNLKNDKSLNEGLIAFNNHIVSMKNVIKKAKVNQTRKLIKQIKLINNKKAANDLQKEKNNRKVENLKDEIKIMKTLKCNDITMFSIEYDNLDFNSYLKTKKNLSHEEIALARLALSNVVLKSIQKMKSDPKLSDSWKRIFIQYKSRSEKRKVWKEKTKYLKDIEEKLKLNPEEMKAMEDEIKADEPAGEESETDEKEPENVNKSPEKSIEKKDKKELVTLVTEEKKINKKEVKEVEQSDDEDGDESGKEFDYNSEDYDVDHQSENEKSASEDEDDEDDESDDQEDQDEEEEVDETESDESEEETNIKKKAKNSEKLNLDNIFVYSKENLEGDKKAYATPREKLKPLVIKDKPAQMEIRQFNLDEIKDFNEIPIDRKTTDKDEAFSKTIKATEDSFFLDADGNEIEDNGDNSMVYDESNFRPRRTNMYRRDFDDNQLSYSSYDRYKNNDFINKRNSLRDSSFKSSLSRPNSGRPYNNNQNNGFDRRDDFRNRDFNRNDRNKRFKGDSNEKGFNNNRNDASRNNNFSNGRDFKQSFSRKPEEKKVEDLSKFHPSWHAKKEMEEKLKSLKFSGKKTTFDD